MFIHEFCVIWLQLQLNYYICTILVPTILYYVYKIIYEAAMPVKRFKTKINVLKEIAWFIHRART